MKLTIFYIIFYVLLWHQYFSLRVYNFAARPPKDEVVNEIYNKNELKVDQNKGLKKKSQTIITNNNNNQPQKQASSQNQQTASKVADQSIPQKADSNNFISQTGINQELSIPNNLGQSNSFKLSNDQNLRVSQVTETVNSPHGGLVIDENYTSDIKLQESCYKDLNTFNITYPPIKISVPYVEVNFSSCSNCTNLGIDTTGFPNSKIHKEIVDFSLNSTWQDILKFDKKNEKDDCNIPKKKKIHRRNLKIQRKQEPIKEINSPSNKVLPIGSIGIPTVQLQQSIFDHRPFGIFSFTNNNPQQPNYNIIRRSSTYII